MNETAKRWNTPHPKKGILCCYDIRIQTVACVCACSWENQLQVLSNTKRSCNRSCSLNQHDYHLKSEHTQLKSHYSPFSKHKPLLLFHIVPFHISSQIKCYSSQFLRTPRAAEKHTRSSRVRWPVPRSGAAPPAQRLTVTTEIDGNTHVNRQHSGQNTPRSTADPLPPPAPCLIQDRTLSFRTGQSTVLAVSGGGG